MKNNQRSETGPAVEGPKANPPRRRGRPPLPDGEAKQHPLIIRTTKGLKDELVRASKASGRSLTEDIEDRLQRTLEEDRGKDEQEIRLDVAADKIKDVVKEYLEFVTPLILVGYSGIEKFSPSTEDLHDRLDLLEAKLGELRTALEADRPALAMAGLRARLDRIREAVEALLRLTTGGGETANG